MKDKHPCIKCNKAKGEVNEWQQIGTTRIGYYVCWKCKKKTLENHDK